MHSKDKIIYFIYFKKEDLAFGKKLMVTHDRALNDWNVYYQNDRSSNFELLQYELKNNVIAPVKPEGPLNFEPMEHLSLLLGRIEPVKLEALKYKMKGDRLGMDKPKEAIAAYTKAMELDPLCDGAQKSRALLYAKTGQRKKALYELLAVHYPGLKGKPTLKQYLGLIKKCSWAFKLLPAQYKTEGFCYAAVKLNSAVFDYIPKKYKTTELGFEVVKKDVFDCRNIPKKCITAELCLAAVRQDGWVIDYIPKEFITAELCMAAIKRGYDDAIEYVPEAIRTVDLYLESVKDYTTLFNRVPEKLKPDLALALVRKNGLFLDYVPEKFMTAELCLEAVKQTPLALDLVPEQYKMAARAPNILWYIY
jgi:hypothetical protein